MFSKFTYRLKLIYLGVGFILFLFLSFKMAFNRTFQLKNQCNDLEMQLEQLKNAPQQMTVIRAKLEEINKKVGGKKMDKINFEELIIEHVSAYCKENNLVLKDYPGIHTYRQQDYITETCKITVVGNFAQLLRLVYGIEQNFTFGKVSSTHFYTEKNFKTKKQELLLEIYVQNIKMI